MGGAANPIVGSLLNGLGTNILAGNDPVKGALINASALAGSGNMGGAIARTPSASAGIDATSQFGNYLNTTGTNASLLNPATTAGIDPNSQFGNYLNTTGTNISTPINNTSYWEQFKLFNRENPGLTQMGFATAKDVLTPEQIAQAPSVPVQARGQLRDFNPMASMDPYRQSVISNQPISLLG